MGQRGNKYTRPMGPIVKNFSECLPQKPIHHRVSSSQGTTVHVYRVKSSQRPRKSAVIPGSDSAKECLPKPSREDTVWTKGWHPPPHPQGSFPAVTLSTSLGISIWHCAPEQVHKTMSSQAPHKPVLVLRPAVSSKQRIKALRFQYSGQQAQLLGHLPWTSHFSRASDSW